MKCCNWPGRLNNGGYAMKGQWRLNRVIYMFVHGYLAPWEVVRHTCDNPACIEVLHLLKGTQADNLADMRQRGRGNVPRLVCPKCGGTRKEKDGRCWACHRAYQNAYYAAKKRREREASQEIEA